MRTEFQKPTLMPLHSSPVQALDQAMTQGSSVGSLGQARMLPRRTSSMGFKEVTSMIHKGSRKKRAALDQEGVDADARGGEVAWAPAHGLHGGHAGLRCGRK